MLTLTSSSMDSCSLYAYPGLGLQSARHRVLPSVVHWARPSSPRTPDGISSCCRRGSRQRKC
jgi:hypothetical protein